jgi:amidohydrolase
MSFTIRQEVAQLHKLLVSTRRQLHSNPELSFQEFDTCEYIVSWLHKHLSQTLEIHRNVGRPTAIVAIIQGHKGSGPCIALRADMDALPIQEDQDVLEFASRRTGVMHACGHDG